MSKTLLLADDSVVIQKLVGLSFANEDVEIVTTDNGDDAVIRAREIKPDVVLADVVMPGKSGYEVCEAIKQDPALAHIPVLLLTGTFEAFDEGRAASAGADGQITKPFEAQSLVERVNEVMNAPVAAPAQIESVEPVAAAVASSADFDFFDASVSTLSAGESGSQPQAEQPATTQTPAIDVSDDSLFGAPGDGASDELDTQGGGMALGDSVTPTAAAVSLGSSLDPKARGIATGPQPGIAGIDHDATVVALPEPVTPLPPSRGDPLVEFEQDLRSPEEMPPIPPLPSSTPMPPMPVELDSALDAAPSDPEATIVAGIDDNNASTSPTFTPNDFASEEATQIDIGVSDRLAASDSSDFLGGPDISEGSGGLEGPDLFESPGGIESPGDFESPGSAAFPTDDEFEDLTIHAPTAAIDQAVASAPSPTAIEVTPQTDPIDPGATIVTNLDISLADSSPSFPADAPNPLDLGPSNVSPDELDFAFDVSEQVSVSELGDRPDDSFSSLMDISESQILVGPNSDPQELEPESPPIDDSIAAGYDVSVSDLVTAPPPPEAPEPSAPSSAPPSLPPSTPPSTPPPTPSSVTPEIPDPALAASEPVAIGWMSANDDLEIGTPAPTASEVDRIPDLSPMIEQQIQETLEKVAWEAFSDLSETIVKQVIGRVEKIAWEVIPQMAETLVREEIRKMKGEND
jgi:CheY-like chemotaxis protein